MKTILAHLMAVLMFSAITTNFCFSQSISDESTSCVVSSVSGKVTYTERGSSTAKPVMAGTVLPEDATINVAKKASFTLACDDRSMQVNQKGTHQMSSLSADVQSKGEVSRFAKMAFMAKGYGSSDTTASTKNPGKGWGGEDSILFKGPFGGKIPLKTLKIDWTPLKEGSVYKLVIYEKSKEMPVFHALTTTSSFTIEPTQLAVKTGVEYHAQVSLANEGKTDSKTLSFTFTPANEVDAVLKGLKSSNEYTKGSNLQKTLLEAMELESKQFLTDANERYIRALRADSKNEMTAKLYAAFLDKAVK